MRAWRYLVQGHCRDRRDGQLSPVRPERNARHRVGGPAMEPSGVPEATSRSGGAGVVAAGGDAAGWGEGEAIDLRARDSHRVARVRASDGATQLAPCIASSCTGLP